MSSGASSYTHSAQNTSPIRLQNGSVLSAHHGVFVIIAVIGAYRRSLLHDADRFVLVHNHPSGNPLPSPEDVDRSFRLAKDMQELGITMLDHIIVSREGYYSFRESKLI